MNKFYEKNKKKICSDRRKKYKNDGIFKEQCKRKVNLWRFDNRKYHRFYQTMLNNGIKVNKKAYDRGEYEKVS